MKYEIVKYSPEFKNRIVELQTHLWSSDVSLNAAYLEWKYERNPYLDNPLIYVVLCAGKVVAMRGMCGAKWLIGDSDETFLGPCSGDSVIAPDHRNRGIFRKLIMAPLNDLANSGYIYTFALNPNPTTRFSLLTMGWRSISNLQTMVWKARHRIILHRLQSYVARLSPLPSPKEHDPYYFLDKNAIKRNVSPYVSVEQTPRPEAMAELIEKISTDGRIRHVRDQEYFSWRFNNPLSRYRFLFWEDTRMEGYLILQTNNSTLRVNIVDWEATNPQAQSDLLEAVLSLGNFDALSIWTATLPDAVKILLERNGFKVLSEPKSKGQYRPSVLVRPVRDEMLKTDWIIANRRLLDITNWDLRMINSDGN